MLRSEYCKHIIYTYKIYNMHLYDIHLYLCIICTHITAFYDDFNKWMQLARGVQNVWRSNCIEHSRDLSIELEIPTRLIHRDLIWIAQREMQTSSPVHSNTADKFAQDSLGCARSSQDRKQDQDIIDYSSRLLCFRSPLHHS